ncbi:MAG: substrate-binding domain-containing protein [Spirochaetales bacterium]|nr:substrate-binding domain-containing protein [Spirochaetales bacterium]
MGDRSRKRTTIGIFIDWTTDNYQFLLLNGILDYVHEHGMNCVFFEGGALKAQDEYELQRNAVYDLAGSETVDGLVILSAPLSRYVGLSSFADFCGRFAGLPAVSVGAELSSMPSIMTDNRQGFRDLIDHLIDRHQARRFAFIRGTDGNPDAAERYETFVEALGDHSLPLDPELVYQGSFTPDSGRDAMDYFLSRGLDGVDAIVAANDSMAVGALETLSRRDPERIGRLSITGFDDLEIAGYSEPPLTTVRQPVWEKGWNAARLLVEVLAGKPVPSRTLLPTVPVIRRSCGCTGGRADPVPGKRIETPPAVAVWADAPHPVRGAKDARGAAGRSVSALASSLVESLRHGFEAGDEKRFAWTCGEIARQSSVSGLDFSVFQELLYGLWPDRASPDGDRHMPAEIRDECFKAVMDLGRQAIQSERDRLMGYLQESRSLQLIREIIVTLDIERQMGILAYRLPEVELKDCYIALYDSDRALARSLLAFRDGTRIESDPARAVYPARDLVPDDFLSDAEPRHVIVKSLKRIGFVLFPVEPKRLRFITFLSDIIGGAMEAAIHYKELQVQKNDLGRTLDTLRHAMAGFIQTMSLTVETRDPYTAGHQHRVSDLARNIAQEMGLSPSQIECIRMAGIIHDLGKIYVPSEILNRSGILDDIEFSMIKRHPQVAFDILKNVDFPWPIAEIVYQHHERLDGSGYPRGLSGDQISLEARILSVADVVEAMASHRPYRESLGIEMALAEIVQNKNTLYEPSAVDACLRLFIEKGYTFKK